MALQNTAGADSTPKTGAQSMLPSRYNFHVPVGESSLLYNTRTGCLVRLDGEDGQELARALIRTTFTGLLQNLSQDVLDMLVEGGFLISVDYDELWEVQQRFWKARVETPIVITITTTQDCNLGCFYCYEERSAARLTADDVDDVVQFAKDRLATSGKRSLHVDWYGGEPLLNQKFIEIASPALQTLCRALDVSYHSSIISNGTRWPTDTASFVRRHAIRQVQISFDGMRENHNRSRRYRPGYAQGSLSSFDEAVRLVDSLLDEVRVDIRINIGPHNLSDIKPLLNMARERGWFARRFPAVIQPARLAAYTDHCGFLRSRELSEGDFSKLRGEIREMLGSGALVEEPGAPDGLPLPRSSVCAALARDSAVIGADKLEYRCGLQVGETNQASARVGSHQRLLPMAQMHGEFPERAWWENFDPTTLESCSRCSFLPVCFGGCPLKHLRRDEHAIAEQGAYWRQQMPRLIAARAGFAQVEGIVFGESDQFRDSDTHCRGKELRNEQDRES